MAIESHPDLFAKLAPRVLNEMQGECTRGDLIVAVIRQNFGKYLSKDIRGEIERMLKTGTLKSKKGNRRINDKDTIWRTP